MRATALLLVSLPALAHPGHGALHPHWHAWDGPGLAGLAVLAGAGVLWWLLKGRR